MDGLPTEMVVNTALKDYPWMDEFSFHVWVAVEHRSADEFAGLPTPKELSALSNLEDALLAAIRKSGAGHYVGRTAWNGTTEFNFYAEDPEAVDERLEKLAEQQNRPISYEIVSDPAWQRVSFFFDYES